MLQDEPTHLIYCSNLRDGYVLPITEDRAGAAGFLE